jgi:hypothetical protein
MHQRVHYTNTRNAIVATIVVLLHYSQPEQTVRFMTCMLAMQVL